MILADTNVWVRHFRTTDPLLEHLLEGDKILMHTMVLGELALGSLPRRASLLTSLAELPRVTAANDEEVLAFIERHALTGIGIGFVDAHLLAAAALTPGARLWTRDVRLDGAAARLGLRHTHDA